MDRVKKRSWRDQIAQHTRHVTVREVDAEEVAALRADMAEAMKLLATEVIMLKELMAEVRDITADELQKRSRA